MPRWHASKKDHHPLPRIAALVKLNDHGEHINISQFGGSNATRLHTTFCTVLLSISLSCLCTEIKMALAQGCNLLLSPRMCAVSVVQYDDTFPLSEEMAETLNY